MTERGATERWLLTALAHSPQTEWAAVRSHAGGPTCERLSRPAERAQQSQTGQADSGTGSTLRWGRLSACPCETCLPAVARPPVPSAHIAQRYCNCGGSDAREQMYTAWQERLRTRQAS